MTILFLITCYTIDFSAGRNLLTAGFNLMAVSALFVDQYHKVGAVVFKEVSIVLGLLCLADLVSVVLYPNGLYQTEMVWNEWSTSKEGQWVFGNKNSHLIFFAIWYISAAAFNLKSAKSLCSIIWESLAVITAITISCLLSSSTSLIASMFLATDFFCRMFRFSRAVSLGKILVFGSLVLQAVILLGSTSFLAPIISSLFGKDLTFSDRVDVWSAVEQLIPLKPIIGWGVRDASFNAQILGSVAFVNAHNQLLNTLYQGGLALATILVVGFVFLYRRASKAASNVSSLCLFLIASLLVEFILEQLLDSSAAWFAIVLCSVLTFGDFSRGREVIWT